MRTNRTELFLQGFVVDRVRKVSEAARVKADHYEDINDVLKNWHHFVGLDYRESISFASNSSQEAFWRTMVGDCIMTIRDHLSRLQASEVKECEEWAFSFPFTAEEAAHPALHPHLLFAMRTAIGGRSIFTTHDGRVGLCEPTTRAGDEVWILEGGRVPFILRPLGEREQGRSPHHALVGDCFLYGVMDGEAYRESRHLVREVVLE
jgi:hypothetical protein